MGCDSKGQGSSGSFLPRVLARGLSAVGLGRAPDVKRPALGSTGAFARVETTPASRAELAATLLASFDDIGLPYYVLRVVNRGPALARDIVLRVDGLQQSEHPALAGNGGPADGESLPPHSHLEWPLTVKPGSRPSLVVELTWVDERGLPGSYRGRVTI